MECCQIFERGDSRRNLPIYGDVVTDEMIQAQSKVSALALNGLQTDRNSSQVIENWRKRVRVERTGDRIPAARRF